jgi:hypothetical protein
MTGNADIDERIVSLDAPEVRRILALLVRAILDHEQDEQDEVWAIIRENDLDPNQDDFNP